MKTISKKKYEKLSEKLASNGVMVIESTQSTSDLLNEIAEKGYVPLYFVEGHGANSLAIVWPKDMGKPNKRIISDATDYGKYHLKVMLEHKFWMERLNSVGLKIDRPSAKDKNFNGDK